MQPLCGHDKKKKTFRREVDVEVLKKGGRLSEELFCLSALGAQKHVTYDILVFILLCTRENQENQENQV